MKQVTPIDVFISYCLQDKAPAEAVCAMLEAANVRCWIAPRDLNPGADWAESIMAALRSSRLMVLIFSSHANSSPQVTREVQRAFEKGLTVMPFRIEDVQPSASLEYYIGSVHWLDALTGPMEPHIEKLVSLVKAFIAQTIPAQEPLEGESPTVAPPPAEAMPGGRKPAGVTVGRHAASMVEIPGAARADPPLQVEAKSRTVGLLLTLLLVAGIVGYWIFINARGTPKTMPPISAATATVTPAPVPQSSPVAEHHIQVQPSASVSATPEITTGALELTSTPPGATIFRGQDRIGVTPFQRSGLPPGEASFVIVLDGYLPREVKATLVANETTRTAVTLSKPATTYEGFIRVQGEETGMGVPVVIRLDPDLKEGTMTQGSKLGDTTVKFTDVWNGGILSATTGEVVFKPQRIEWEPESFTLGFSEDGKIATYKCAADGQIYTAELIAQ